MLWELGKIKIGLGTLVNTNQRLESAIKPYVEQLSNWVKTEQPPIHIDETPSKELRSGYGYLQIRISVYFERQTLGVVRR